MVESMPSCAKRKMKPVRISKGYAPNEQVFGRIHGQYLLD